jgi:hypothetical protein
VKRHHAVALLKGVEIATEDTEDTEKRIIIRAALAL